jgi:hypothetical protein
MERAQADAEHLGSLAPVAGDPVEDVADHRSLNCLERLTESDGDFRAIVSVATDRSREIARFDQAAARQHDHALDNISQLAHIARP